MSATETRRLRITGVVQGVGYRYHMAATAQRLGIAGWVRNRRDGSVEAVIMGNMDAIAALIHWAQQGPAAARVDEVVVDQIDEVVQTEGFHQHPTE